MLKLKNVLNSIQVSQTHKFHVKHILRQFSEVRIKTIFFFLYIYWCSSGFIFDQLILFFKCCLFVCFFPQRGTFLTRLETIQLGAQYSKVYQKTKCTAAWFLSYVFCRQLSAPLPTGEFHPAIEKYETHQTPFQRRTGGVDHLFIYKSL